jgi:hypothetical protein
MFEIMLCSESKMNLLYRSLNLLCRDWRLRLVAFVLAVGSIVTAGQFAYRVRLVL